VPGRCAGSSRSTPCNTGRWLRLRRLLRGPAGRDWRGGAGVWPVASSWEARRLPARRPTTPPAGVAPPDAARNQPPAQYTVTRTTPCLLFTALLHMLIKGDLDRAHNLATTSSRKKVSTGKSSPARYICRDRRWPVCPSDLSSPARKASILQTLPTLVDLGQKTMLPGIGQAGPPPPAHPPRWMLPAAWLSPSR
jgi:hypothetical protein